MFDVPILFLIFNRPEPAERVFSQIRKVKPRHLFVAADGPRPDYPDDKQKCEQARKVITTIDWACELHTLYRDTNLGCGKAVSEALEWFFSYHEKCIIIEDDVLPDISFFHFANEMLEKYKDDKRIFNIIGTNIFSNWKSDQYDYFFSKSFSAWGWATWRRSFKQFDLHIKSWPEIKKNEILRNTALNEDQYNTWVYLFDLTYEDKIDTWDYQWCYSFLINNGLSIIPSRNLIKNIGFNNNATHTKVDYRNVSNLDLFTVQFPLKHPTYILPDLEYDNKYYFLFHPKKEIPDNKGYLSILKRIELKCKRFIKKFLGKWI